MKRRTTTRQLSEALTNGLFTSRKKQNVIIKTSRKTDVVETDKFLEELQFLCETNIFIDYVGWHYQKDYKTNQYISETGRMDGDSENIITVHMRANRWSKKRRY